MYPNNHNVMNIMASFFFQIKACGAIVKNHFFLEATQPFLGVFQDISYGDLSFGFITKVEA
jgi:hypothetical protein